MTDKLKLVEMKKVERRTRVTFWLQDAPKAAFVERCCIVTHFAIDHGVLTFEDDKGQKFCTNLPFLLEEDFLSDSRWVLD